VLITSLPHLPCSRPVYRSKCGRVWHHQLLRPLPARQGFPSQFLSTSYKKQCKRRAFMHLNLGRPQSVKQRFSSPLPIKKPQDEFNRRCRSDLYKILDQTGVSACHCMMPSQFCAIGAVVDEHYYIVEDILRVAIEKGSKRRVFLTSFPDGTRLWLPWCSLNKSLRDYTAMKFPREASVAQRALMLTASDHGARHAQNRQQGA